MILATQSITGKALYGSGNIVWKPSVNSKSIVDTACDYLRKSTAAGALLNYMVGVDDLTIICTTDTQSTFYAKETAVSLNWKGVNGSLVTWNPQTNLETLDKIKHRPTGRRFRAKPGTVVRGVQSPAMGLIHELGHARQYLFYHTWFMYHYNNAIDNKNNKSRLIIEEDNLLTVESVVARQLGENVRWKYDDIGKSGLTSSPVKLIITPLIDPVIGK